MKPFIIIGILLVLAGISVNVQFPGAGLWMFQVGLIFLLGALAVSRNAKINKSGLFLMTVLFLWGFINGMWYTHPLGAIMSIIGWGWVIYRITRNKERETDNRNASLVQEFSKKLLPSTKQHIKWIGVPLSILFALWLFKSILIAFVVGFGVTAFFDRQSIQTKGLNRVAVVLLLYAVGFFLLLAGTFKIDDAYNYNNFITFFTWDSRILLRGIMRGL